MFRQNFVHIGFQVFDLGRFAAQLGTRNGFIAQIFQKFAIAAVIGGIGNGAVKFVIGLFCRAARLNLKFHFAQGFVNFCLLRHRASRAGKARSFDFNGHTQFQNFQHIGNLGKINIKDRPAVFTRHWCQHKNTGPLARFKQTVGLKGGNGFAHNGTANPELFGQGRFGGQF